MSLFRKPAENKVGAKFMIYGEKGTGKTLFALSFPNAVAIDAEMGMAFYEGTEDGKNLLGVMNAQSYRQVQEAMTEVGETFEEGGYETVIVDSITKVRENLIQIVTNIDEKRTRLAGKSVEETGTSVRSWGRIKLVMNNLQNLMLDMTAKGINVVYIAQAKEVKEKQGDQFVVTGHIMDAQKGMEFDFDVNLFLFTETDLKGNTTFKARVEKDRTQVFRVGQIIENPNYELWRERIEKRSGKTIETTYESTTKVDEENYDDSLDEESKPIKERVQELLTALTPDKRKEFVKEADDKGIDMKKMSAKDIRELGKLVTKYQTK